MRIGRCQCAIPPRLQVQVCLPYLTSLKSAIGERVTVAAKHHSTDMDERRPLLALRRATMVASAAAFGSSEARGIGRRIEPPSGQKSREQNIQTHTPPILYTNTFNMPTSYHSGCGKREAHISWSKVIPSKAAPVTGTTLRTTGPVPADSRQ